jgi:hypothetical protein
VLVFKDVGKSSQRFTLVRYLRVGVYSGGVVKLYGKMG